VTSDPTPDRVVETSGPDAPAASGPDTPHAGLEAVAHDAPPSDLVDQLTAERDEFLNALQLVKADFDNYRKRVERDRATERQAAGRDILMELLPVMDNLDRALAALGEADDGVRHGVEMVRGQLAGTLSGRGITEIEAAEHMPFDPTVHEAVVQSHSPGFDEGTLITVVEKGYRQNDSIIRPAKVVVAAAAPNA
jgi:molecular chaperone GrpE